MDFTQMIFSRSGAASARIVNEYLTHFKTALHIMNAIMKHSERLSVMHFFDGNNKNHSFPFEQTGNINVMMYDILLPHVNSMKALLEGNNGGKIVYLQNRIIHLAHGADVCHKKLDREAVVADVGN